MRLPRKSRVISFRMDVEQLNALRALAAEEGVTISELIRREVDRALRAPRWRFWQTVPVGTTSVTTTLPGDGFTVTYNAA